MKSYIISDNEESLQGMRLTGIDGEIIREKELILEKIDKLIKNPSIGIIILTQGIKILVEEEVMIRKLSSTDTLIVEIPCPREKIQSDFITKYIRESIGLKL